MCFIFFFFSSRRRHTRFSRDWSSDVCSSDLGVTRQSAPVAALNNARLLAALFADDSIKNRRNTEAVETAPSVLVSARVLDHKPASQRPFGDVKDGIAKQLAQQEALMLARRQGAARLEELK